jgi:hypothetical protein
VAWHFPQVPLRQVPVEGSRSRPVRPLVGNLVQFLLPLAVLIQALEIASQCEPVVLQHLLLAVRLL